MSAGREGLVAARASMSRSAWMSTARPALDGFSVSPLALGTTVASIGLRSVSRATCSAKGPMTPGV
jgi:hypothetical protein